MRSKVAIAACLIWLVLGSAAEQTSYRTAVPGYRYQFQRDYFNHSEFQTEWWYYTGNLRAADGHRFGFELTFFRQGVNRDTEKTGAWDVRDLYVAHLALSDLDGGTFFHDERMNRAGPGIAGASEAEARIWNGNWSVAWKGDDQSLRAMNENCELEFTLHPEKAPVIHGENGVSQKAAGAGRASHYISLTRLDVNGKIRVLGKNFAVNGTAWMDHEFFTHQLEKNQAGWDWFSIQMEDRTELMLFRIRRADGSVDPFSAGTFVDAAGKRMHLRVGDFSLTPEGEVWRSKASGASYPIRWKVTVPRLGIELEATTPLASQEIAGGSKVLPNYWEGAIQLAGKKNAAGIGAVGYLEMTGYDKAFAMGE
jgi:predicted secreted hydrolase